MAVTFSRDLKGLMHINKCGVKNGTPTKSKYPSVGTLLSKSDFLRGSFFSKVLKWSSNCHGETYFKNDQNWFKTMSQKVNKISKGSVLNGE